jgi:hypothetical protein
VQRQAHIAQTIHQTAPFDSIAMSQHDGRLLKTMTDSAKSF